MHEYIVIYDEDLSMSRRDLTHLNKKYSYLYTIYII